MPARIRISLIPIFLLVATLCCAQTVHDKQRRRDQLEHDIEILRKQLSSNESRSDAAISSLGLIQAQAKSRQKLLAESDRQIGALNHQVGKVQSDINTLQAELDTLEAHYDRLVMGAYKNRDVKIWYMYILASEDVSQAFRRFGYFKGLSSQISAQAKKVEAAKAALSNRKVDLLNLKNKEQLVRQQRAKDVKQIKADQVRQQALVNRLKKNSASYRKSLEAKRQEMKVLDRQIAQMLSQAAGKTKKKPVDYTLAASFEKNKGKLPWPVEGPVAEHYGKYQNKELKLSLFNNGINIACDPGSKVKAVFDGVVSNIMIAPGYGQCILVQHGDYYTTYCKVKASGIHPGDKVKTGQVIGEVATIMGKSQLYFLVWKKVYLDPELWLRER